MRRVLPGLLAVILIIVIFAGIITVTNGFVFMTITQINKTVPINSSYNFLQPIAGYFGTIGGMIGITILIIIIAVILIVLVMIAKVMMSETQELTGYGLVGR